MPELPEVEMKRRYLEATSLHQIILAAKVKDTRTLNGITADVLEKSLEGLQFESTFRHGKRLFLRLKEDLWLTIHLGLTGDLVYFQKTEEEPSYDRLLISFQNGYRLAYSDPRMFGGIGITDCPETFLQKKKIGPDALHIDLPCFLEIMSGRKGMIKTALLNQHLVAGLGNLYADEALFQAGIDPRARALDEAQLKRLFACIQEVLQTAISCHLEFRALPDSYLLHSRRPGGRCPRDGAPLEHARIGGRTSYFCPEHQR